MSAVLEQPAGMPAAPPPAEPRKGSLLRAEFHRFRARRFMKVVLGLALLAWLGAGLISLSVFGVPTPADRAEAQQQLEQVVEDESRYYEQCLKEVPDDSTPEEWCGSPLTASDLHVDDFMSTWPFEFAEAGVAGAMAFAFGAAVLAFVVGTTWIGAEWSSRSLVALLFWVPRRVQVMGAKITVLVVATAVFGLVAQLCWLALAGLLEAVAGDGGGVPDRFWGELLGTQARGVLLVVLAALGGFGLANLVRNTGAALGIGFVYFAIVEPMIGVFQSSWQPWLLTNNVIALLYPGGFTVYMFEFADYEEATEYLIGNLQAGFVLGGAVAVFIGIGVAWFSRRDLH
jgi:hypothetical protein